MNTPYAQLLSPEASNFISSLQRKFGPTRDALLERRVQVQSEINSGVFPDFLKETQPIRTSEWKVAPIPADLTNRRVEITGPVDRKMVINALNSGAKVFMADFEDSHSPTWEGTLDGQINLQDAIRRTISYTSPEGKSYSLNNQTAVLMVRPRGWHLVEKHFLVDGKPISASLFDFGLYFFHNARELLKNGTAPYFYLPKMESHLEARLWNEVFVEAQTRLGLPQGTIRATVLIETILAAFEMDEILYELKDHALGLNCGRWDYIFSFIKKFQKHTDFVLPDRAEVTMGTHFLESYCKLLIQTCHRRGAHAMGGMAAQIPIKSDPTLNAQAVAKVRADKEREVRLGHDGTWVAHPGLVSTAMEVFNEGMKDANQIGISRETWPVAASDLLRVPKGTISEAGLKANIQVALAYLESWLRGNGCVPLNHLMEDAATAEISRSQVWQWLHCGKVSLAQVEAAFIEALRPLNLESGKWELAARLLKEMITSDSFTEFMTLPAYDHLP